jgi:hypothetical protein
VVPELNTNSLSSLGLASCQIDAASRHSFHTPSSSMYLFIVILLLLTAFPPPTFTQSSCPITQTPMKTSTSISTVSAFTSIPSQSPRTSSTESVDGIANHPFRRVPTTTERSESVTPSATNVQPCNGYVEFCDRKYSNISLVVAHNSPFAVAHNGASNQDLDVLTQLDDGIRGCELEELR